MAIIKQYNAKFDVTYVYESESYWDPQKKQSRSKRKLIGRIDPETGAVVPTGGRGRKPKAPKETSLADTDAAHREEYEGIRKKNGELTALVSRLNDELSEARAENRRLRSALEKLQEQIDKCSETCGNALK